jgi:hypothetical protein
MPLIDSDVQTKPIYLFPGSGSCWSVGIYVEIILHRYLVIMAAGHVEQRSWSGQVDCGSTHIFEERYRKWPRQIQYKLHFKITGCKNEFLFIP